MNLIWDNLFRNKKRENSIRTALKENFLFQDLTERELRFVEDIVHHRRHHTGEMIFRQNEVGVGMYLILKGRVEIFISDPSAIMESQNEIFITMLTEGDFFGELALVETNGLRTASAISRDESELIGFFRPDLMEILARSPSTGIKIVFRLAEVLGRRLKETTDKVSDLRKALKELRTPPPVSNIDEQASNNFTS